MTFKHQYLYLALAIICFNSFAECGEKPCLQSDKEMKIAGISLGDSAEKVIQTLGPPLTRTSDSGVDDGGKYDIQSFIYPNLKIEIARGKVDGVISNSTKIGTPSGIRPGLKMKKIRKMLGVTPAPLGSFQNSIGVYFCPTVDERALIFKFDKQGMLEELRLATYRP